MKPILSFSILALAGAAGWLLAQGPLNPPAGPPGPGFKTLQQVEPRFDLLATPAPPGVDTSNANYHFIINQPGSYYFSANLGVTKTSGIQINAEGVTLDLNGFQVSRTSGTGGNGIEIPVTAHRASVRNGSIKGFANGLVSPTSGESARACAFRDLAVGACTIYGIFAGEDALLESCRAHDNIGIGGGGIAAGVGSSISNCTAFNNTGFGIVGGGAVTLINCNAYDNTGRGIAVGPVSALTNCIASANGGIGIDVAEGCSLTNCTAESNLGGGIDATRSVLLNCTAFANTGTYGINAGIGSSLSNCVARENTSSGASSYGIYAVSESTLVHCTSTDNANTGTPTGTTGVGIFAGDGSTIKDCTVQGNKGDGILVDSNCQVIGNTCDANGNGTAAAPANAGNIRMTGSANRVELNLVTNCDYGIVADADRNFIARNTARTNTFNYIIVAGNRIARIVVPAINDSPIAGANSGSADGFTGIDPWANFSF